MRYPQQSFAGGELSPSLHGRSDLDRYAVGAKTLRNFLVTPQGVLVSRCGTQHVATFVETAYTAYSDGIRLAPIANASPSHMMAVAGWGTSSRQLFATESTDARFAFTTLSSLQFYNKNAQGSVGDLRFISTAEGLMITGTDSLWPVVVKYSGGVYTGRIISLTPPSFPLAGLTAGGRSQRYPRIRFETLLNATDLAVDPSDFNHALRPWNWLVTYVVRNATHGVFETEGYKLTHYHIIDTIEGSGYTDENPSTAGGSLGIHAIVSRQTVYPDRTRTIWTCLEAGDTVDGYINGSACTFTVVASRLYRGRDGQYGYIGESKTSLVDDNGQDPDYGLPPPGQSEPFNGDPIEPEYAIFHEGRLYVLLNGRIYGSAVGQSWSFELATLGADDRPLEFTLESTTQENIASLAVLDKLLVFTTGGVWLVGGSGQDEVITPNSIAARKIHKTGASTLQPAEAGDAVFFAERKGGTPRAVVRGDGGFAVSDMSLLSRHLFEGYALVSWAWDEGRSCLWCVRSDGLLLSLTYVPEMQIFAWAQHEMADGGLVECVACKPDEFEDSLWLVVNHDGTRCLERMAYAVLPLTGDGVRDVRYAVHLDRSVTYNGAQTSSLTCDSDGDVPPGYTGTLYFTPDLLSEGDIVSIDGFRLEITGGDTAGGEGTYRVISETASFPSSTYATTPSTDWWILSSSVAGLDHLEGQTVWALADGAVYEDLVVSAGSIDLGEGNEAGIITVGLRFNADFESLNIAQEKGKQKIVSHIGIEAEHARGGQMGPDLDHLEEIRARTVADGYGVLALAKISPIAPLPSRWSESGSVAVRQDQPLPFTLLSVTREYSLEK